MNGKMRKIIKLNGKEFRTLANKTLQEAKPLSVQEWAYAMGYGSYSAFRRAFISYYQLSPSTILRARRLDDIASAILENPEITMQQVAEQCGFIQACNVRAFLDRHINMTFNGFKENILMFKEQH